MGKKTESMTNETPEKACKNGENKQRKWEPGHGNKLKNVRLKSTERI
jgi:hypothetical protein